MFNLGVLTDEIDQDFEHALDVVEEWGLRTIELHSLWGRNICDLEPADLTRALRMVRQRGMRVCAIASLFLRCPIADTEAYRAHLEILERSFRLAELFDTRLVRCFSFWREDTLSHHWETLLDRLELPVRMAERAGMILAFENVRSCLVGTGAETRELMLAVHSPAFRSLWDVGNALVSGEKDPYPAGYEAVRPWIIHVHVKDAMIYPDGKSDWQPIGDGQVDFAGQLVALHQDAYEGVISLETHYKPTGGSKEQGSRESFAGLTEMLSELGLAWV
ncbi:MAG TPA: sugar phosphate isomerase/epimerase family protein [Armatimonadota bacterium]|nr:sugar phosphate isomerase/epimerase family protein [Armatimonadota bacterium]